MRALIMKKHGFTLAEVLISLGIVAVVAALTAPSLINLMPDKSKLKVIKAHKIISDATSEMLNNPALYRDKEPEDTTGDGVKNIVGSVGLADFSLPLDYNTNVYKRQASDYTSPSKYAYLLMEKLELSDEPTGNVDSGLSFTTIDGMYWTIIKDKVAPNDDFCLEVDYKVTIDLDGPDKGENSIAKSGVKRPDQFQFKVDTYGKVTGVDTLTKNYLKNNMKLNDRDNDYKDTGM